MNTAKPPDCTLDMYNMHGEDMQRVSIHSVGMGMSMDGVRMQCVSMQGVSMHSVNMHS